VELKTPTFELKLWQLDNNHKLQTNGYMPFLEKSFIYGSVLMNMRQCETLANHHLWYVSNLILFLLLMS